VAEQAARPGVDELLGAPPPPVVRRPNAAADPLVIGAQL